MVLTPDKCGAKDVRDWQEWVGDWIQALKKRRHYLVIISDAKKYPWLDAVREVSKVANEKKKNVFFLLKLSPEAAGAAESANDLRQGNEGAWHIEPLTAVQCGAFLRAYAERTGKTRQLKDLLHICEKDDEVQNCDRWFFACSGGRPKGLIELLEHGGRSLDMVMAGFAESLEGVHASVCGHQLELSFLWGLCVEKARVSRASGNGLIDIQQIASRMGGDVRTLSGLTRAILRQQLPERGIVVDKLAEMFDRASVKFSEEMLVASLGHGKGDLNFQPGIADWLRSVMDEGCETEYVDIIAESIAHALQCCGAYANGSTRFQDIFGYIDELEVAVGNHKNAHAFFSALKKNLQERILSVCFDGLGFLEDEAVVDVASQVLSVCGDDEQAFLGFYRSVMPIFGLCICDPLSLPAVDRVRKIWCRLQSDGAIPAEWLPELLGTALLCVFRERNSAKTAGDSLFYDADNFVSLLNKLGRKNCGQSGDWVQLIDALDYDDPWKMSSAMSAILDAIGGNDRWSGVVSLFAVIAVYMNDCHGEVKDFLWPRLVKALEVCRIPFDQDNRVMGLSRFPVLWRRAYSRYVARKCSPWAISAQIDDVRSQLDGLQDLSPAEVLRYLPELVRHFSVCVRAKSRGDAKYASVLQEGWRKIQRIAEREDWFNVINLRARHWVVSWSGDILRDAMTKDEQNQYFERLVALCESIDSGHDAWYHNNLLVTCGRLAKDALMLQRVLTPVEHLVFDRYPDMLPRIANRSVYRSWYECAREWFCDYLGKLPSKRSSFDVLVQVCRVISGCTQKRCRDDLFAVIKSIYGDADAIERSFISVALVDDFVGSFVLDDLNRRVNGNCEESSRILLEQLFADDDFLRGISDRIDKAMTDEDISHCSSLVRIVLYGIADQTMPDTLKEASFVMVMEKAICACRYLVGKKVLFSGMVTSVGRLYAMLSPNDPWRKTLHAAWSDFVSAYADNLRTDTQNSCVDAVADERWLESLWACPSAVLGCLSAEIDRAIYDRLHRILSTYSANWLEGLCSDWFYAVYKASQNIPLQCCSVEMFDVMEDLALQDKFMQYCLHLKNYHGEMLPLLNRILEERKRRGNGKVESELLSRYRDCWNRTRPLVYGKKDISELHPNDQNWIRYFETALAAK